MREALTLLDAATRRALEGIGEIKADDADPVRKQQAKAVLSELSDDRAAHARRAPTTTSPGSSRDDRRRAIVVAPLSVAGDARDPPLRRAHRRRDVGDPRARRPVRHRSPGRSASHAAPSGSAESTPPATGRRPAGRASTSAPRSTTRKQGILYVAAHLPRPTQSGLSDAAAEELVSLVTALGGRTLGLFSSRKAAERAAEVLRARTDLTVLLQGDEALPLLIRAFRDNPATCLMGVMSLWQGVDVPGDACQLVVIDRLPFPRPDEPLAAARSAAVDAAGGSGFAAVSVPIAAVRLAQGVGRLIRSTTDRGVVAVLDSRLETARGYGAYLRASLPPFWYTTKQEVALGALQAPVRPEPKLSASVHRPTISPRRPRRVRVRPPAPRGQVPDRGVEDRDDRHRDQRADDAGDARGRWRSRGSPRADGSRPPGP